MHRKDPQNDILAHLLDPVRPIDYVTGMARALPWSITAIESHVKLMVKMAWLERFDKRGNRVYYRLTEKGKAIARYRTGQANTPTP